jgi:Tol biopolymer transport system component
LTFDHRRIFGPPAFTQDRSEIIFSSNRAGLESLWRISVRAGNLEAVSRSGPLDWYPSISHTGNALAFEYSDDEQNIWQIQLQDEIHSKGSARILIPAANAYNFLPQFAPDGRRIAFQSNRSGYPEI